MGLHIPTTFLRFSLPFMCPSNRLESHLFQNAEKHVRDKSNWELVSSYYPNWSIKEWQSFEKKCPNKGKSPLFKFAHFQHFLTF